MTARSFVYLIETALGQIKIGCSHWPEQRLKTFVANAPCPLRLIAKWPGEQTDERKLHQRFAAQRWHNEWFRYEGDLIAFVEQNRGVGVENIPEWAGLTFAASSERRRCCRASAAEKSKALWADPEFRERTARNRACRSLYEHRNRPCDAVFVDQVNAFLDDHSAIKPWVLGEAIGDRSFVWSLKYLTPKEPLRQAAIQFMANAAKQEGQAA